MKRRVRQILQLANIDHWEGISVTPEEATAIAGTYLFNECILYVCRNDTKVGNDVRSLHDRVLTWLLRRQSDEGTWPDSPHVTAQCLKSLDTSLSSMEPDHPNRSACISGLRRGMQFLLRPDTQVQWTELSGYQQMDILAVLLRLSKRTALAEALFESMDIDGSAFAPDVFISYGGPDEDFAKRLAVDFETAGIRVWFAKWDLDYGDDVVQEIEKGLTATKKFVIVLSPASVKRPWVKKELSAAFQQALSGPGKLIIPAMYRHTDPPPFLAAHRWVDFTQDEQYPTRVRELVRRLKGKKPPRS